MTPWYREPWAWFILSPLIVVVLVSTYTIYTAVKNRDDVVNEDYYKEGRMINVHLEQEQLAQSMGLAMSLKVDHQILELVVDLNGRFESLNNVSIEFSHPSDAAKDKTFVLESITKNRYRAGLLDSLKGRWYVKVSGLDDQGRPWRLMKQAYAIQDVDNQAVVELIERPDPIESPLSETDSPR